MTTEETDQSPDADGTEIRALSVLPARRQDIELHTGLPRADHLGRTRDDGQRRGREPLSGAQDDR